MFRFAKREIMCETNLINSIKCNCCKWKYKYRSLSNSHGCSLLTKCVASWMRPLWTASRMRIRLSSEFNGTDGSTPASAWNFSAASLNPSKKSYKMSISGQIVRLNISIRLSITHQWPNNSWLICSCRLV